VLGFIAKKEHLVLNMKSYIIEVSMQFEKSRLQIRQKDSKIEVILN